VGVLRHDCFVFFNNQIILFLFHFIPSVPIMEGHNLNNFLLDQFIFCEAIVFLFKNSVPVHCPPCCFTLFIICYLMKSLPPR
jgi:hypothetical protein